MTVHHITVTIATTDEFSISISNCIIGFSVQQNSYEDI